LSFAGSVVSALSNDIGGSNLFKHPLAIIKPVRYQQ